MIPLPEGVDACDIGELTVWCRPFRAFFTAVPFDHDELFVSEMSSPAVYGDIYIYR